MAFEPKGTTTSTGPGESLTRTRTPWQTPDYDDKATLEEILAQNPNTKWYRIRAIFNDSVPASRRRSVSSVCSKGKRLMRAHNGMHNLSDMAQPAEVEAASLRDKPPAMTPYTPTEDPATYMETLCNSWDGTLGDQGYTNIITEDLETLETKKRIAMEVAAGFYRL